MGCGKAHWILLSSVLWQLQTAAPVLDKTLPFIRASYNHNVFIPSCELLALVLAVLLCLAHYHLLWTTTNTPLSLSENTLAMCTAVVLACGAGLHAASVIVEMSIGDLGLKVDSLSALLHTMHEYMSHNIVLVGVYGLQLLAIWREINHSSPWADMNNANNFDRDAKPVQSNGTNGVYRRRHLKQHTTNSVDCNTGVVEPGYIIQLSVAWLLPVEVGLYNAIHSLRTSTELTLALYSIALLVIFLSQLRPGGRQPWKSSVLGFYAKSAVIGLVVLLGNGYIVGLGIDVV